MTGDRQGFDPRYFDRLADVEDRHFWFTSRNRLLARVLDRIAPTLPPAATVLEIGTGTGNTLRVVEAAFPRARVVGMDLFAEGLPVARRRTGAQLVQGATERPPFARPFDIVAAFDVLEHVEDDRAAMSAIQRLVRPNGWLVVTVPALQHLWSAFDDASHHWRRYERDELGDLIVDAGFQVERLTFFMATLYPLVRAARFFGLGGRARASGANTDAIDEGLTVVPVINPVLAAILGAEARLVGRGRRLPIGTSLLAVARSKK